jgi:hypothetical protein
MNIARLVAAALAAFLLGASGAISITGQLLAYQDGYVFFTSGDGFRVAPNLTILDDKTKAPSKLVPGPRLYARAVFSPDGVVTELDLSRQPLPLEPLSDQVAQFAVTESPRYANPELAPKPVPSDQTGPYQGQTFSGKPVLVTITVQVPPTTPPDAQIYITTDVSGWNPQAIPMDRIDALHFRITQRLASGTILHYYYTRGTQQSEERAENGLDRPPHVLVVSDADVRAISDIVYYWADQIGGVQQIQPNTLPTPYNPAPFPNLPARPAPTHAP